MFRNIILILLLICSLANSDTMEDWEAQKFYDLNLLAVLSEVVDSIDSDAWPDCRGLIDSSLITEFPGSRLGYAINDEIIPVSNLLQSYSYYLVAADSHGVRIKARSKFGGRSYIYDSEWNVVHYVFHTPAEARIIGKVLVEWLIDEKYKKAPKDDNWRCYAVALGYRGCYTDKLYFDDARFDMLGCFGSFLAYDDLRAKVFEIVSGGRIFADEAGREKVVRGIISNYGSYPKDLQKEVLEKIATYLKTVDDEKTNYSKKIAEFVLENGGTVPDRLYWEYDTSWHPFLGGTKFQPEGKSKKPATLNTDKPSRDAEGGVAVGT